MKPGVKQNGSGSDRLRVITDNRQPALLRPQPGHDVDLQLVQVLVLVHQDMSEHPAQMRAHDFMTREGTPVEQQVVKVEDTERVFPRPISSEQAP